MPKRIIRKKPAAKAAAKHGALPKRKEKDAPAPEAKARHQKTVDSKLANDAPKAKKGKVVRDSFTMPESEYALINAVKKRCISNGIAAKKSEILRAAIGHFAAQNDDDIRSVITALELVKTGRPPKGRK